MDLELILWSNKFFHRTSIFFIFLKILHYSFKKHFNKKIKPHSLIGKTTSKSNKGNIMLVQLSFGKTLRPRKMAATCFANWGHHSKTVSIKHNWILESRINTPAKPIRGLNIMQYRLQHKSPKNKNKNPQIDLNILHGIFKFYS